MRVAVYARVSTSDQHAAVQLGALREYAARQGWEALEFVDQGVSGARAKRPALDAMLEAVHRRAVDAVAVTKLDRLGRSVRHLCELAEDLKASGVRLIVLEQSIDTESSTGRLLFHVLGAVSEFELELVRERTRAAVEAARRQGRRPGRRPVLDRAGRERAQRLAKAGHSVRKVAAMLGVSVGAAHKAMKPESSTALPPAAMRLEGV